jgi:hypothetical protein
MCHLKAGWYKCHLNSGCNTQSTICIICCSRASTMCDMVQIFFVSPAYGAEIWWSHDTRSTLQPVVTNRPYAKCLQWLLPYNACLALLTATRCKLSCYTACQVCFTPYGTWHAVHVQLGAAVVAPNNTCMVRRVPSTTLCNHRRICASVALDSRAWVFAADTLNVGRCQRSLRTMCGVQPWGKAVSTLWWAVQTLSRHYRHEMRSDCCFSR